MNNSKKYSYEEKVELIRKYPFTATRVFKETSEDLLMLAVTMDADVIGDIENPSEDLQLQAIKGTPWAIRFIENPTDKIQIKALEALWSKPFYDHVIKDLPNKTDWFQKEFNRLKVVKGPLK